MMYDCAAVGALLLYALGGVAAVLVFIMIFDPPKGGQR